MQKLNQRSPPSTCFSKCHLRFHVESEQNPTAVGDLLFTALVASKLVEITRTAISYGDTGLFILHSFIFLTLRSPSHFSLTPKEGMQSKLGFTAAASPRRVQLPSPCQLRLPSPRWPPGLIHRPPNHRHQLHLTRELDHHLQLASASSSPPPAVRTSPRGRPSLGHLGIQLTSTSHQDLPTRTMVSSSPPPVARTSPRRRRFSSPR
jgi:hypothetical protein